MVSQSDSDPQTTEGDESPAPVKATPPVCVFATGRPFPRKTLEQALAIGRAIKEKNAGNAWAPKEIAAVLKIGPVSSNYYSLTAASRDYGLTIGTRDTLVIELT